MSIIKKSLESLLPLVSRPSRYINHEWNAVHKSSVKRSVCLCFPDIYELGISNEGLEILYHIINNDPLWRAERCYLPDYDMQEQLKTHEIPLSSLESSQPLSSFDVVGITLQYELCYTNILALLDCAGIPARAKDRDETLPLIIGGGPCCSNPEPAADFFDLFVLGDGEEVITELLNCVNQAKENKIPKKQMLEKCAHISGIYVPSLYQVDYNPDGTVRSVQPINSDIPAIIHPRIVDLNTVYYPEKPIVTFMHAVHDRLNIEISRGCPHRCRFCHASYISRPARHRHAEKILSLAEQGIAATGYEEISLGSLSSSDHPEIEQIVSGLAQKFDQHRIALSLPSLRCEARSLELAQQTRGVKKSSLTFAPEVASERMRSVINKHIPGAQILTILQQACASGWRHVKLYYMYGLPWEEPADIEAIIGFVRYAKKTNKRLDFNITISPFVPKPHTPFQWCGQDNPVSLHCHCADLARRLPGTVRAHDVDASVLEAVLARGDRRLSAVVEKAYQYGCMFDQWKERLQRERWKQAFAECGLDPAFYANRWRPESEIFPWEHLGYTQSKQNLYAEYTKSRHSAQSEDLRHHTESYRMPVHDDGSIQQGRQPIVNPCKPVERIRIRFKRTGIVRFVSHLEQITMFRRVFRRANLPLAYTQGFHPQPKISFGPAIAVGYTSNAEYVDVELIKRMDLQDVKKRIICQLPQGFELVSIKKIPVFFPSLDSVLNEALYRIHGPWPDDAPTAIDSFLQKDAFLIQKVKKRTTETIDLSRVITSISMHDSTLELRMQFGPKKNVRPTQAIQEIFNFPKKDIDSFQIHKVALYVHKQGRKPFEP
ncbi:MAG: TIGR03960 family B12-binding radical SAM protein [Elusimicrobia bacterium]|nr:TIGR03960 family B12-binding radical SAM protein [Elusimicrobiota bacterium]MBD3412285.1 TIGR03960 family B12-binding radical SAM protein [Elusimicrobiota bacterium]